MNLFFSHIRRKLPRWWNTQVPTEGDFYRICRRERIRVVEMPLRVPGYYMACNGRRFIIINSALRGVRWLHVAFHELGHHLLHAPKYAHSAFFFIDNNTKEHAEAEAFALCTMIPEPLLRRMLACEIEEEYGFTREMLHQRLRVLDLYGV
jgi:Zn-dependent peptidase ImmA (M78 family)